jgi:mannose/fructose-specific phosphotransferase system component IIA
MIMRALVVTHGELGRELVAASLLVVAGQRSIEVMSNADGDARHLRDAIAGWLAVDAGPAMVLVDEGAGSCGTAARLAAAARPATWLLAGVNLAMVVTYLGSSDSLEGEELAEKMLARARQSVRRLGEIP